MAIGSNFALFRFLGRPAFDDVPLTEDWHVANLILSSMWSLSNLEGAQLSDKQILELLKVVKERVVDRHRTKMALETVTSIADLNHVLERNGTAQATMEVRTPEWLEEQGKCKVQMAKLSEKGGTLIFLSCHRSMS
jgi:hypothetical protein